MDNINLMGLTLLELAMIYALVEGNNPFDCSPALLIDIDAELNRREFVVVDGKTIRVNEAFDAIYQHFEDGSIKRD